MLRRYLLFAGGHYYPNGGWNDFVESFDNLDQAKAVGLKLREDWYHIFDTEDMGAVTI